MITMNAEMKFIYLKNHYLASNLTEEQILLICDAAKIRKAHKGEIIQYDNANESKVCLLLSGKAKITEVDDSGNELIREIINEGDLFGKLAFGMCGDRRYAWALVIGRPEGRAHHCRSKAAIAQASFRIERPAWAK